MVNGSSHVPDIAAAPPVDPPVPSVSPPVLPAVSPVVPSVVVDALVVDAVVVDAVVVDAVVVDDDDSLTPEVLLVSDSSPLEPPLVLEVEVMASPLVSSAQAVSPTSVTIVSRGRKRNEGACMAAEAGIARIFAHAENVHMSD
jgi:hypothetical protein